MTKIYFKKLDPTAIIPKRGSQYAAGLDLSSIENITVEPRQRVLVSTGLSVSIPQNTYLRIAPRSGLAVKFGVDVLAGVVDSDYRGELKVVLINLGDIPFSVNKGDRIAQAILERCEIAEVAEADELEDTNRGTAGFGSTGI